MLAQTQQAAPEIVHDGVGSPIHGQATEEAAPPELWRQVVEGLDLAGRMEHQPYQTTLIALGVGFLASGALFSRFSTRAISMAMRLAVLPALEKQLLAATRSTPTTAAAS